MKKYTLLLIIGGLFLMIGIVLFLNNKKENVYYQENTNLTQEEASNLILEKVRAIVEIYENPKETFMLDRETDEDSDYLMVLNFDTIISNMYTEKGQKEVEKTKFGDKSFVKKEEEYASVLKSIPDNNKYSDCSISISNVVVNLDEIKGVVSFTKNEIDQDNVLTYHVYEKNIELIKKENKWLVNTFIYSNV